MECIVAVPVAFRAFLAAIMLLQRRASESNVSEIGRQLGCLDLARRQDESGLLNVNQ